MIEEPAAADGTIRKAGAPAEKPEPQPASGAKAAATEAFRRSLRELTPRVWVVPSIVVINVAILGLMVRQGLDANAPSAFALLPWGANYGAKTLAGQPWRLLSSAFLHIGALHLILNMVALSYVGAVVERIFGPLRTAAIYLTAAILGSALGVIVHPDVVSVGASGAVFGVYGALYVSLKENRAAIPTPVLGRLSGVAVAFLACNLLFADARADIAAHIGGLLGGAAAARRLALPLVPGRTMPKGKPVAVLAFACFLALTIAWIVPAPEDVAGIMKTFFATEKKLVGDYNALLTQSRAGTLSDRDFANKIDREILPPWRNAKAQLQFVRNVTPRQQHVFDELSEYAELRERSWTWQATGRRDGDADSLQKSSVSGKNAEAYVKAMAAEATNQRGAEP